MHTDIIIGFLGVIGAVFGGQGFWAWVTNRSRKKSNESKLMLGIGYSKIVDLCEKHLKNEYITTTEFHELEHYLYEPYHNMGGNGTVEQLMEDVKKLPKVKSGKRKS